jgi:CDGSH-type Zn-finger protein
MSDVTIRLRANGPIVVTGPFRLVDAAGNEFQLDETKGNTALCRCGQSSKKPFCDGTHKTCGFVAEDRSS